MADTKVSAFPSASSVSGTDIIPIVQGGVTKQAQVSLLPGGAPTGSQISSMLVMSEGVNSSIVVDQTGDLVTVS